MQEANETIHAVVVNDEEQYSLWPAGRTCPAGWREVGVTGDRETCLAHIRQVWTDMRPRSLRTAEASGTVPKRPSSTRTKKGAAPPSTPRGQRSKRN